MENPIGSFTSRNKRIEFDKGGGGPVGVLEALRDGKERCPEKKGVSVAHALGPGRSNRNMNQLEKVGKSD